VPRQEKNHRLGDFLIEEHWDSKGVKKVRMNNEDF